MAEYSTVMTLWSLHKHFQFDNVNQKWQIVILASIFMGMNNINIYYRLLVGGGGGGSNL